MKELVSFLTTRKEIAEEEKQGRISGSVEWRRARGELGKTKEVGAWWRSEACMGWMHVTKMICRVSSYLKLYITQVQPGYVFKPNEQDIQAGR